ncbi:MAG: glycosyltransferase family 2 protein, partial [Candidatus Rokuibacteriota bacterium]
MSEAPGRRMPRVTVVMPVYNAEPYVREALVGVLRQTFEDFELLAIDDGSTDGSLDVLRAVADSRLRVVSRPHQGVVRTMNTALELARAELIARADADDVCLPERLERQVQFLAANPGVALVGGVMRSGTRLFEYPRDAARMRWLALYQSPVGNPTILFRRRAALAVGGYPDDFQLVDDYPFVSRLLARYDAANLAEPLVLHRANPTGISGRHPQAQLAEGDRVRRANIAALVPEPEAAEALFGLLVGRAAPA